MTLLVDLLRREQVERDVIKEVSEMEDTEPAFLLLILGRADDYATDKYTVGEAITDANLDALFPSGYRRS